MDNFRMHLKFCLILNVLILVLTSDGISQHLQVQNRENSAKINKGALIYQSGDDSLRKFFVRQEPVVILKSSESVYYETNNGSEMLLRVSNASEKTRCHFYINGKGESQLVSLPPNMPDSTFYLIKDWAGSQLLISNVTDSVLSSKITVLLVGN